MEVRFEKSVLDNKYSIKLSTKANQVELDLIKKFGEPRVDVGGAFIGPPAFTEPTQLRNVVKGFPYTFVKDANADVQAEDKSNVWQDEMQARILNTMQTLRNNIDDFSGDVISTV